MKEIITRIDLHTLKNETHARAGENLNAIFVKHNPQALGIKPLYELYRSALNKELEAFDLISRNDLAAKIADQDHARSAIFRGFISSVRIAKTHFDHRHREAAHLLYDILKRHENEEKMTFDSEVAANDSLGHVLQQSAASQAIAQLGMGGWHGKLTQENTTFAALIAERNSEIVEKIALQVRASRAATDRYYSAIVNQMENLWMVGITSSIAFIKELNATIEQIRHAIVQEAGKQRAIISL
ncbi:MAG: DUF6261 family protein [Prevotellaceae bacterium]|jgi:hypothetical protein|nr:DUF6261 family protein [Prevotellaceae bacterium]